MRNARRLLGSFIFIIGIAPLTAAPAFGQQFEVIYPNGLTAVAEKALPPQVYLSQQNILEIKGEFFPKNQPDAQPWIVQATGFIEKASGHVVSARHLLVETVMDLAERYNEPFYIDENGVFQGVNYDYKFFAVLNTATARLEYPLEVVAMGPMDTYLDVILFKPLKKIPVKNLALSSNIKPGDKVYASGFTTQDTHYHKANGKTARVTTDKIKFTAEHVVLAILQNETIASIGVKKLYRLAKPTQSGFSGGPVFNTGGQVIGIMIEKDSIFSFAISSDDITTVIKSIK